MCMWQSHALAGGLSLGASVPDEYGTCCALARRMPRLLAAAVIASTPAAFIKSRRSVDIDSMDVLTQQCFPVRGQLATVWIERSLRGHSEYPRGQSNDF